MQRTKMKAKGHFKTEYMDWWNDPLSKVIDEFKRKIETVTGNIDKTVDELVRKGIKGDIKYRQFWASFGPNETIQFYIDDELIISVKLSAMVKSDIDECDISQTYYLRQMFLKQVKRLDRAIKADNQID